MLKVNRTVSEKCWKVHLHSSYLLQPILRSHNLAWPANWIYWFAIILKMEISQSDCPYITNLQPEVTKDVLVHHFSQMKHHEMNGNIDDHDDSDHEQLHCDECILEEGALEDSQDTLMNNENDSELTLTNGNHDLNEDPMPGQMKSGLSFHSLNNPSTDSGISPMEEEEEDSQSNYDEDPMDEEDPGVALGDNHSDCEADQDDTVQQGAISSSRLTPKTLSLNLKCSPLTLPLNGLSENGQSSCSPQKHLVSSKGKFKSKPLPPRQSWLLRLFESKLFDMSIAISYLYNSKEPGVQTYLGK